MVALYVILVHAEIIQVNKEAIQQYHPEGRMAKITQAEAARREFSIGYANAKNISYTIIHTGNHEAEDHDCACGFHDALQHLRPDHRFHAAQYSVYNDADPCYPDNSTHFQSGEGL